jgi:4-amino-4-deoxy-L-arabinose transferase-like glycosyltransferase
VLCFFTTLSLYGLLRQLLLRHGWRWYALGGFAAGLGVITKGVGFLPLLVLLPFAYARWKKWPLLELRATPVHWSLAPIAFVAAVLLWLVPMLLAVAFSGDPALAAYRDEILLQQTVTRYATAWHHRQPFYYFLTVMLTLWLPLVVLLPWLVPRWIERLRQRDARILLLLGWVLLVLLFFSASPGKRGVYILPALPALAVASGEWLRGLWQRLDVQRAGMLFALFVACVAAAGFVYLHWIAPDRAVALRDDYGLKYIEPLAAIAIVGTLAVLACGVRRGALAAAWVLGLTWLIVSFTVVPQINASRSSARFIADLEKIAEPERELGLLGYKEQFLLQLDRPSVNFGHARWREGVLEAYDAARWLNAGTDRELLVAEHNLKPCFGSASLRIEVGTSSGDRWFLVSSPADTGCAAKGSDDRVFEYRPPGFVAPKNRDRFPTP